MRPLQPVRCVSGKARNTRAHGTVRRSRAGAGAASLIIDPEAAALRGEHRLSAVRGVERPKYGPDVTLYGVRRKAQLATDQLVGHALDEQIQHVALAPGQARDTRRRSVASVRFRLAEHGSLLSRFFRRIRAVLLQSLRRNVDPA